MKLVRERGNYRSRGRGNRGRGVRNPMNREGNVTQCVIVNLNGIGLGIILRIFI